MKKLILILSILFSNHLFAQDLIVTTTNDSINCKVGQQQGSFTLYKINTPEGIQSRAINNNSILKVQYNFYTSNNKIVPAPKKYINETSFNAGIGYTMLFKLFDVDDIYFKDYYNDLSNGINLHAEIQRSFNPKLGLSLRYDYFKSSAEKNNYTFVSQSQNITADIHEEVTIHTLSPGLYYKIPLVEDMKIKLFGSYDHNFYDDAVKINSTTLDVFGNKSGLSLGIAYEKAINKNIDVSLQIKYRASKLNKITYVNGSGNKTEIELYGFDRLNINRLTLGLNISLK